MIGLLSIIVIGFVLGMRHATDPDHVVAVTTIVSQQRNLKRAALVGAFWGLGHTVTIFVVGSAIILLNVVIPVRLGLAMELAVGFMLILLGGWSLAGFAQSLRSPAVVPTLQPVPGLPEVHEHAHSHGDLVHTHVHGHGPAHVHHLGEGNPISRLDRIFGKSTAYQFVRPLAVGIVHGLAGSAAVALLILASIRNSTWALAYLLVFGVGTIAGMMLVTLSIASAFRFVGNRSNLFGRGLVVASGLVSLVFGLFVAYQICVVQGLFGSSPQWTPH